MIAILISFESIDISYTQEVDLNRHIVLGETTPGIYTVVKQGVMLKELFQTMLHYKSLKIQEENDKNGLSFPLFVCLSAKNKKVTSPIFKMLSQDFERHLLYFNIDKSLFEGITCNRSLLDGNQICFGESLPQLKLKEELRLSLSSLLKSLGKVEYIVFQKNANEIKELKKEGKACIIESFDTQKFKEAYEKLQLNLKKEQIKSELSQQISLLIQQHAFAKKYLQRLIQTHKQPEFKSISPFDIEHITISHLQKELIDPSAFFNITPKSWVNNTSSKEISSYIFQNISDNRLYIARASKPKQFSNQEDTQIRILSYYLTFLVDSDSLSIPHCRNTTLMKFSKIKNFDNKKAFLNIRPYIQNLQTLNQFEFQKQRYTEVISKGQLFGRNIKGLGGILLFSWIVNEKFNVKTLIEQIALVSKEGKLKFLDKNQLKITEGDIFLCRTDFFNVFTMKDFKIVQSTFILGRLRQQTLTFKIEDLHESIIKEMCLLLECITSQRLQMIKNLFIYYRWNSKLVHFWDVVTFRLKIIRQKLGVYKSELSRERSLLYRYPLLSCLLIPEDYTRFMIPRKDVYYPISYDYQQVMAQQKVSQNPYLAYMNKACSFCIHKLDFPVLSFLQWIKAGGRYQIIQYVSMINKSFQQYLVMDKRLKLTTVNDKKNAVLIVDHAELCEEIIEKPKSVKTILIYRLRKPSSLGDLGILSQDLVKQRDVSQSQDQLISILYKWGSNFDFFKSKVEFYQWIVMSYSNIKTNFYNLPQHKNLEFLMTFHREISTNRHRLKQLEENHKDLCKYLYTYPIFKENQKISFNYRLFEFIQLTTLFTEILGGNWNCRLKTYQNSSVNLWRSVIQPQLACKIIKKLMDYTNQISNQKMDITEYKMLTNDALQLVRTLTQVPQNSSIQDYPFCLSFQFFPEVITIKNYLTIQSFLLLQDIQVVVDDQNIELNHGQQTVKISKQDAKVIDLVGNRNILTIFSWHETTQMFSINQIEIQLLPLFGYKKISEKIIMNPHIKQLLLQIEWKHIKISKNITYLAIALANDQKIRIILVNILDQNLYTVKDETFESNIVKIEFLEQEDETKTLFVVTSESVFKYLIRETTIQEKASELLRVNFGITNAILRFTEGSLNIILYKLHIIERYTIVKNEVIKNHRFQLNRNIKTLTVKDRFFYVFYQNCDSMDLFISQGEKLEKLWNYYWVELNCQELEVKGQDLFLKGLGYIKHLRLRNIESLQGQMMKMN